MNCSIVRKGAAILVDLAVISVSMVARGAQPTGASQQPEVAGLTDQLRIGAEFFLNRTETPNNWNFARRRADPRQRHRSWS